MITVNNESITLFELDSEISLKSRIAKTFNTLPKYLYIQNFNNDTIKAGADFKSNDFLKEIKKNEIELNKLAEFKKNYSQLDIKEALKLWICYNSKSPFEEGTSDMTIILFETQLESCFDSLNEDEESLEDFKNYFKSFLENNINGFKTNLDHEIIYFRENSIIDDNILDKFQSAKSLKTTTTIHEKLKFKIVLNLENIHILEIFNAIQVNENIPFASCKQYFKILKDFLPLQKWKQSFDDTIVIKMNPLVNKKNNDLNSYLDVVIYFFENKYEMELEIIFKEGYLDLNSFEKRFRSIFPSLDISFSKTEKNKLTSVFLIPDFHFNSYTFLDMIMNDRTFSNLMYSDERRKTTKRSKDIDIDQYWIHFHFEHPSTGKITASMLFKTVDLSDIDIINSKYLDFKTNDLCTKVKVNAKTDLDSENFKQIISKICYIYREEKATPINDFYRNFIEDFAVEINAYEKKQKRRETKVLASEVFIARSARQCQHHVSIANEEDLKNPAFKNNILKFPRDKQADGKSYPSDGINQMNYVCKEDPAYPYIGLQENKLEKNKNEYPYLPCCFKTNQYNSKKMNNYYLNMNEKKEYRQQNLIKTDKFLEKGAISENLPVNLRNFFQSIDSENKYVRMGVERSPSSFIDCILLATENNKFKAESLRKKFGSDLKLLPMSRQFTFNLTQQQVKSNFENVKEYLDPKMYFKIFELFSKCNIFIFNENELVLPVYSQNYLRSKFKDNNIFIIEHYGAESNHATYPQCEIIVKFISPQYQIKTMKTNEPFCQKIHSIFDKMVHSYSLDKEIKVQNFEIPLDMQIKFQNFDCYGKTRLLLCENKLSEFTIITEPLYPLYREFSNFKIVKCDLKVIENYFEIVNQTVQNNVLKEVHIVLGNIKCVIPVNDTAVLQNIKTDFSELHYTEDSFSQIDVYNKNKKNARYLIENMIWMFSKYIHENKIENITDQVFYEFSLEKFVIEEKTTYDIPKNFSYNNNCFKNEKLIVVSSEMLKRLMYVLRLFTSQNYEKLLNYHKTKSIFDYYLDITDFDKTETQIILQGENSLLKLIEQFEKKYDLFQEILITNSELPYFFQNNLISRKVFLAQNTDTLVKALTIGLSWVNEKINKSIYLSEKEDRSVLEYSFSLIAYLNKYDIKIHEIEGSIKPKNPIKIIGYKIEDISKFTVLLDL